MGDGIKRPNETPRSKLRGIKPEEIKMIATKKQMTISDYLLSFARKEMPKCGGYHCNKSHKPNKETAKVLMETDKEENLTEYETLEDFWDALGFCQHA